MSDPIPSIVEAPAREAPAPYRLPEAALSSPHPTLLHSGMTVARFYALHLLSAIFPVAAGLLLYGWRAMIVIGVVVGSAAAGMEVWRRIGRRGYQLHRAHVLWLALLLALMLPVHPAAWRVPGFELALWPILPAAGLTLVIFVWVLGGPGSGRVHPALVTLLLLAALFQQELVPHWVLQRTNLFRGDALDAAPDTSDSVAEPWLDGAIIKGQHATYVEPVSQRLIFFTSGKQVPERAWLSLDVLMRDRMPPLEDLVVGGHPGAIGLSSAIAVVIGGLFLMYRGVIDFRIPMLIVVTALGALLVLPVPAVITEEAPRWRWLVVRETGVDWAVAITFVSYELLAGPLIFMAFFLATAPSVRPMSRRARALFAVIVGFLAAAAQLYISVSVGPYLALLAASLSTPLMDKFFRPRPLV